MNIKDLIDAAKNKSGMQLGQIAEEMHIPQAKLSEWKKGKYRPGASQIIYLAEKAELPAIEVLAEFEIESHPEMAIFWKRAVSQVSKIRVNP